MVIKMVLLKQLPFFAELYPNKTRTFVVVIIDVHICKKIAKTKQKSFTTKYLGLPVCLLPLKSVKKYICFYLYHITKAKHICKIYAAHKNNYVTFDF